MSQRILAGRPATISVDLIDQNGEAYDPSGAVTVTVTNYAGETIGTEGATATASETPGTYTLAIPAADIADLDQLTAAWTYDGATVTTTHDVVGGVYFTIAEARASHETLAKVDKYSTAEITRWRQFVEAEFEQITGRAYVPRLGSQVFSGRAGGNTLAVNAGGNLRGVRSLSISGTALTDDQLLDVVFSSSGDVYYPSGFTAGTDNIVVTYEYGYDQPPDDLREAMLWRLRDRLNSGRSAIPDRATSFTQAEGGGTFSLTTPGVRGSFTGIPDVDAIYDRYCLAGTVFG